MKTTTLFRKRLLRAVHLEHPKIVKALGEYSGCCGFTDGGCYDLARAINYWAGEIGTYIGFWRCLPDPLMPQCFDHALVGLRIDGEQLLVDATGAVTAEQAHRYWENQLWAAQRILPAHLLKMDRAEFNMLRGEPVADVMLIVDALFEVLGRPADYGIEPLGSMPTLETYAGMVLAAHERLREAQETLSRNAAARASRDSSIQLLPESKAS